MTRDADASTIRAAYRRRAQAHHPDRLQGNGTASTADEMSAINEAYRVLSDPARRVAYDRSMSGGHAAGAGPSRPAADRTETVRDRPSWHSPAPPDPRPARVPWRFMGVMAAIGVGVVLVGAIFTDPPGEEPPDGILRSGSCVTIEPNGDAREVPCTGSADLVVDQLVPVGAKCPGGTEPHRDRLGLGTACVVRPPD